MKRIFVIVLAATVAFLESFDSSTLGNTAFGLGIFAWFLAIGSFLIGFASKKEGIKRFARTLLLGLVVAIPISSLLVNLQKGVSKSRGDDICVTIDRFKATNGRYPENLLELVPTHLSQIPPSAMGVFTRHEFHYSTGGGDYRLGFSSIAMIYCSRGAIDAWYCGD